MKKILILAALLTAPVVANAAVGGGGHAGGFGGGLGGFHGGVDAGGVHPGGAPAFYPNGFAHGPGVHYGPGWRGSALIDPIAPCYPPPYYYDPTYGAHCG